MAMPTIRKGSSSSQISGYSTSAIIATGQHTTSKMHQSRNLIIGAPLLFYTAICAAKFGEFGAHVGFGPM